MNQDTKQKRRARRSPQQWKKIVEGWRASGQTAEDYAEKHDLGVNNLWRWSGRFGKKDERSGPGGEERRGLALPGTRFLAVQVGQPAAVRTRPHELGRRQNIEITWPRGPLVRLSGEVTRDTLAAVMQALAEAAPC